MHFSSATGLLQRIAPGQVQQDASRLQNLPDNMPQSLCSAKMEWDFGHLQCVRNALSSQSCYLMDTSEAIRIERDSMDAALCLRFGQLISDPWRSVRYRTCLANLERL